MFPVSILSLALHAWAAPPTPPVVEPVEQPAPRDASGLRREARLADAAAAVSLRQAYFDGQVSLAQAFPHLDAVSLTRTSVLQGRLALLDDAQTQRAGERVGAGQRVELVAVLDAEDRADALERRLLLGVRALILARPELEAARLDALRRPWSDRVAQGAPDDDAEGLPAVAQADAALHALSQLVEALVLQATVPGAPAPGVDNALALLQGEQAPSAMVWLDLAAPALPAPEIARVRAAQLAWLETVRLPQLRGASKPPAVMAGSDVEVLRATARRERALLEQARSREQRWAGDEPYVAARRLEASLEAQVHQARVVAIEAGIQQLEEAVAAVAQSTQANVEAERAQAKAEQARREAQAALDQALTARRIEAGERAAAAWKETSDLAAQADALATQAALRTRGLYAEAIDGAPPTLEPDAAPRSLDAVYLDLRAHIHELESQVDGASARLSDLQPQVAEARARIHVARARALSSALSSDPATRAEQQASIGEWVTALDDELRAWEQRLTRAEEARDAGLRALHDAKALRRQIKSEVSRAVRADDTFAAELQRELSLLPSTVVAMSRNRLAWFGTAPSRLTDLGFVWGLVVGLTRLLLVLALGAVGQRLVPAWVAAGEAVVRARSPLFAHLDLSDARAPAGRALRGLVLLATGWLFLGPLDVGLPELAAVVALALHVVAWRALDALFQLCAVPRSRVRPALRVMTDDGYAVARWTLQTLSGWWLARHALARLLLNDLGLDATHDLVQLCMGFVGLAVLVAMLGRWEPLLRRRLAALPSSSGLVQALAAPPPRGALAPVWGLGSGLFLLTRACWGLLQDQADQRERLGQLFNVVTRYRFSKNVSEEPREPLAPEQHAVLCAEVCPPQAVIPREAADTALDAALEGWEREARRGLVALLGDHGDGKRTWLLGREQALRDRGLEVRRLHLHRRLIASAELYGWLCDELGLPLARTEEQMLAALRTLPRGVYILEGAHLAFLRAVGGFDALRGLLYLLNASSDERFWIAVFHRPAWRYLQRLGALIDVGVFRDEIDLAPMNEHLLRRLCEARLQLLEVDADFGRLVRPSVLGGPPDVELDRTINQFFRLIADASGGNPAVALELFAECLALSPSGRAEVHMVESLSGGWLEGLQEQDLFTLVALRVQDALDERELVHVTNLAPARVRATVKLLQSKGLLVTYHSRLRITESQLPAITRTLRRRHFIQWAV